MSLPTPPDPRQPTITPSTGLLFARGIVRMALFTVILGLISYWSEDGLGVGWAIGSGTLWGYWDMVRTYRRPEWRHAVAPEQMLGLGTAGLICILALAGWTATHPDLPYLMPRFIGLALIAILPLSLMRMAAKEYRTRRRGPPPADR